MAEKQKRYRLVYPDTGDGVKGTVERELTDTQVQRMKRAAAHPHARLQKIEEVAP